MHIFYALLRYAVAKEEWFFPALQFFKFFSAADVLCLLEGRCHLPTFAGVCSILVEYWDP
jgi:hypothetical protein